MTSANTRKKEEALKQSESKYRQLIENLREGIWVIDKDALTTFVNPRMAEMLGYAVDEMLGKHLFSFMDERGVKIATQLLERRKQGIMEQHYFEFMKKDSNRIHVALETSPITDENGNYNGALAGVMDMTEYIKMQEKIQIMNDKLSVVGGLSRHDVRNKLTSVIGYVYLAKQCLPENSEALNYLQRIEGSVQQIEEIFNFAAIYEKLGIECLTYIDVGKAVDEAISLFPKLDIKVLNSCHGLTVLADKLLVQLVYNLVDNSLKYGEKVTQIQIRFKDEKDEMKIFYEDDGVGIPMDAKSKLYVAGYTSGKGSGLGLNLVKKMIEVYGWNIVETGIPGKGAQFTLTIPRTSKEGKENYHHTK